MSTDLETSAEIVIEGMSAALRYEVKGLINGQLVLVAEHVTRMHDSIAPDTYERLKALITWTISWKF